MNRQDLLVPSTQQLLDNWVGLDRFLNTPIFQKPAFPPYDIIKFNNCYEIVIALAGYTQEELNITQIEDVLVVEANKQKVGDELTAGSEFLHKGIAKRQFKLSFNISPEIEVDGSSLKDGMLKIKLHRNIPEQNKPKQIPIIVEE